MAESGAAGFLILAIIILAGLVLALGLLNKIGFFTPSEKAVAETVATVTWEQLLEEVEAKKTEWRGLIAVYENTMTLPTSEQCENLKKIRDAVAKKISEASSLGAPEDIIRTATKGLASMNEWLKGWQCQ